VIGANPAKDRELKLPGPFLQPTMTMSTNMEGLIARVAAASRALWVDILIARRALAAKLLRRAQNELERELSDSTDRFEIERRERAWNRWQPQDGSLLGR
jgi:hypothetical protein